jgi:hypothetical protein
VEVPENQKLIAYCKKHDEVHIIEKECEYSFFANLK